ncbi:MAG: cell division protein FtsL [Pseudomonadota bacterium]
MAVETPKRTIKTSTLIILVAAIMIELFLYTWCHVQSIHMGYMITSQVKQEKELKVLQEKLRLELAQLRTPERIIQIASKQLGLVLPAPDQVIVLE